jgi:thiamine biosynthesis lipoprotein
MNRRRFLALSATALLPLPGHAATITEWQGPGLGTTLSLRLVGADPVKARRTFLRVEAEIARIESLASLHRDSELTRLNRDGHLAFPSPDLLQLLTLAGRIHDATGGVFDPTVQPLWQATANGGNIEAARALVGWNRVQIRTTEIRLDRGQALTLNGIAQGWAADRIATLLRSQGFEDALIDMGEVAGLGPGVSGNGWVARITTPTGESLSDARLVNRCLATSSPFGTVIGAGQPHILGPLGQSPHWHTISVSATSATVADALSTAFCLMDDASIYGALDVFPTARLEALA